MQVSWNYMVIIICIGLAGFAVYREYRRVNQSRLVWRLIAVITAITALACVALPIGFRVEKADNHDAVLLTAGFNPDSLGAYAKSELYIIDPSLKKQFPKAKFTNLAALLTDTPAIRHLYIFGYGLDETEIGQLSNLNLTFHPSVAPGGITAISWNSPLKTGDILQVQGSYYNPSIKPVKLILKGLNASLDSVLINPKTTLSFNLLSKPKHFGRAIYHLQALAGTDTLSNESLPVEVSATKPLKILMLAASPDFENKFLKNWLSQNGYGATVRAAISKDKFTQEFVNMDKQPLDHLTPALLQTFDVVIGDLSVLKTLTGAESSALKQAVTQQGLGLIIRADSSNKTVSWLQAAFPVERQSAKTQTSVALNLQGSSVKTGKLNTDPIYISYREATQPLITDEQNHIVASSTQAGAGRLLFTTLGNTYSWMLGGNADDYTRLWSLLISKTARKVNVTQNWSVISSIPVPGKPVQIRLERAAAPLAIHINQSVVAPAQNPLIPFEWINTYWPLQAGWQQIRQDNGGINYWYAWPTTDWQNIRALKRLNDTRRYIATQTAALSVTKQIHQKQWAPVHKIYFYMLFLMACTFLWAENKFTF